MPLLAALALAIHSWFAFVGEPMADDFDFLHHTFFSGRDRWFDGGGSRFYWRPVARQLYYRLLGDTMLAHPAWVSALEVGFAALAGLCIHRALRRSWPGAWAAAAASFPLLIEAGRPLVSSPTNFQDLGAILWSAVALHEAAHARRWSALAALLAGLLCKEMVVVTAVALPLVAGAKTTTAGAPPTRRRLRWLVAVGILVVAWAVVYRIVLLRAGLLLARDAGQDQGALAAPWLNRFVWACGESLGDAMSLPALTPALRGGALAALATVAVATIGLLAADRAARARVMARGPWVVGGLAWFVLATATLADVYPDWRPYRSPFGAIGLGVACVALLGAAWPPLLAALVAVRLVTFAASPPPPERVAADVASAYSLDFAKLVRLQRLVGETRRALAVALPPPAHGARVAAHYYPRGALYAFAGDRALQTWYRDTTLHWVPIRTAVLEPNGATTVALELQPAAARQVVPVSPQALWHLEDADHHIEAKRWAEALASLKAADSLERDPDARMFASMLAGKRAMALVGIGRVAEAETQAARSLALWPGNDDARYARVGAALRLGRLADAEADLEALARAHPSDAGLRRMLDDTRRARRAQEAGRP